MHPHIKLCELVQSSYEIHTHSINELEFIYLPDKGVDKLAFRGTELTGVDSRGSLEKIQDIWDVVRDLRVLPWPVKINGIEERGHAGFIRGAMEVVDQIQHDLRDKPVICTGHSLGGAVALVAGLLLAKSGKEVEVVTFGCPHVFLGDIIIPDNCKITMYKNGRDIVTYVPLGNHPVKQTTIGKPSFWLPNVKDHGLSVYNTSLRNHYRRD